MKYYFLGQELQDIIGRSDTTTPIYVEEAKMWKIKVGNTMFVYSITILDDFLLLIKYAKIPEEAWDTLAKIYYKEE